MTIFELKHTMLKLNRSSIVTFVNTAYKVDNVKVAFDNSFRTISPDEAEDFQLTNINNEIYLPVGTQCLVFLNPTFDKNEAELAFNGCCTVVNTEDDFLNLWEFYLDELERLT